MKFMNSFSERNIIREILRQERCANQAMADIAPNLIEAPISSLADIESRLKIFSGVENKNPRERVARVNKALLRAVVVEAVKQIIFQQGLPFIHLSFFPRGYRTLFAFRIDCDACDRESYFKLRQYAEQHELRMTWFIDVGAQEAYLEEVAALRKAGQDVQLHCYHHQIYSNRQDNEKNLRRGKELLEAVGVPVRGFAAPFGQWNPGLNQVLEDLSFSYSSEFAIGYDDLPFYPFLKKRLSRVLQIPIHPICMGSLAKAGYSPDEMKTYFNRIIELKYQRRDPILLYGHPRHEMERFPETVDFIFSSIREKQDVWFTTLTEYADWWQRRLAADFEVKFENDCLCVATHNNDSALQLHIERSDSMETYVPLRSGRRLLAELAWSRKEACPNGPTTEIGHIAESNFKNIARRLRSYVRESLQRIRNRSIP